MAGHSRAPQFVTSSAWAEHRALATSVARLQAERVKWPAERSSADALLVSAAIGTAAAGGAVLTLAGLLCGPQALATAAFAAWALGVAGASAVGRLGARFREDERGHGVGPELVHSSTLRALGIARSAFGARRLLAGLARDGVCRRCAPETYAVVDLAAWPRALAPTRLTPEQAGRLRALLSHATAAARRAQTS